MKKYNFYGWETADVKDASGMDPREYYDILSRVWSRETCTPRLRDSWSPENITVGQCAITAFLLQDYFGGDVYGVLRPGGNYHCFNVVDGCVFDLTSEQFGDEKLDYSLTAKQSRAEHFKREEKKERYENLRELFEASRDEMLAWQEQEVTHIVNDKWIDFRKADYRFPDGTIKGPFYSYTKKDYVVVVATDEEGKLLCVKQFRHGIGQVTTELPAGGIEKEDDALGAAKRELLEETGYESEEWKQLLKVASQPTLSDNYAYIFSAENCKHTSEQSLDETEFLGVEKYSVDQVHSLIKEGKFQQPVHIMALLLKEHTI
ncbi:NUDIX hydrolase [Eubacterium xylanophilum]|uniref:NUDIX hydrolase n=1 Tax=Eubacterium xylanophilum TaxID=39497 RepID=UPI0004B2877C|nr:NUDIX hydrolase [Eubacterium xylanophilum]